MFSQFHHRAETLFLFPRPIKVNSSYHLENGFRSSVNWSVMILIYFNLFPILNMYSTCTAHVSTKIHTSWISPSKSNNCELLIPRGIKPLVNRSVNFPYSLMTFKKRIRHHQTNFNFHLITLLSLFPNLSTTQKRKEFQNPWPIQKFQNLSSDHNLMWLIDLEIRIIKFLSKNYFG